MFIVPALVIFAHLPMPVAVGASLMAVVATSAGASVAFVRDGWTNLKVAIVLECATVTGAIAGALLAGLASTRLLELLFALVVLQSAYFSFHKRDSEPLAMSDPLCRRLGLGGSFPACNGAAVP
ncbi:MAG TPA: sulfite exporter TauE/SafE family protein, partial [Candidatus Binataceae bacterium]|nr:sulfite exporter TauE/SafE family protein [Candidatus Binataceae bacterium]